MLAGAGRFDPLGIWKPPVPKPIVMAVNGIAYTLAIELALASDIVVAAEDVRFCQLEVGRGLFAFEGGAFRAPLQLGWGNAMHFLLTAQEFGAEQALRIGLVQEVVGVGEHLDRARQLATVIAARSPVGVQATLGTARAAQRAAESAAASYIEANLASVLSSDDAREGLHSFLQRRDVDFSYPRALHHIHRSMIFPSSAHSQSTSSRCSSMSACMCVRTNRRQSSLSTFLRNVR